MLGKAIVIAAIAAAAYYLFKGSRSSNLSTEEILKTTFGEPTYSKNFTLQQVREWVKAREELLKDGCKAVVVVINNSTMKELGKNINLTVDVENYIVIAIVNSRTKDIGDHVLIKYDSIDEKLKDMLSNGNGILVVGG